MGLVDDQGDNAVMWAARQGHPDCIKFLLQHGVHLNQQNKVEMKPTFVESVF